MTETREMTALERLRRDEDKFGAAAARRRPMKFNVGGVVALLALSTIFIALFSLFTVPQTSHALVVRLGDPVRTISEPGLHMKMPGKPAPVELFELRLVGRLIFLQGEWLVVHGRTNFLLFFYKKQIQICYF